MKNKLAVSAFIFSLFTRSMAASAAEPVKGITFERHKLSNGLTVILHEDQSSPVVAVGIWYKIGAKNEEPGKTGLAHLFEHYMFEGDAYSNPSDYFKFIFGMGGTMNANTGHDRTYYFATVPPEGLEEVLRLESNRMFTLREKINQQSLDKQRGIVQNEKRLKENAPYGQEMGEIFKIAWGDPSHPYNHKVIGSMEDLNAASVDDVRNFHKMYYAPNNAIIAVSGSHDARETLAKIQKWFGEIPSGPLPPAVPFHEVRETGRREVTLEDGKAPSTMVSIAYPFPGKGKKGNLELSVAAELLMGGRASRLVKSLQYDKRLVTSISPMLGAELHEAGIFWIRAIPAEGVTPKQVEDAVNEEIAALVRDGVTEREMARVKAKMRTSRLDAMQEVQNIADSLTEGEAIGNAGQFEAEFERINDMTPEEAREAAARYLTKNNSSVVVIVPAGKEK